MAPPRSAVTLWLLWAITGLCGGHLFYVGRRLHALVALFTLNFVGVGWIVDGFRLSAYNAPTEPARAASTEPVEINVDSQPSVTPAKSTVPLIEPQPSNSPKIAGAAPSASPDDVVLDGTERDTVGSVKDGEEPQDSGEKSEAQPGLGVDSPEGLTMEQLEARQREEKAEAERQARQAKLLKKQLMGYSSVLRSPQQPGGSARRGGKTANTTPTKSPVHHLPPDIPLFRAWLPFETKMESPDPTRPITRLRSLSLGAAVQSPLLQITRTPIKADGSPPSDPESTDAESTPTRNLRSRSKSGDLFGEHPAWKKLGSVRSLFRSKSHSVPDGEHATFFLWDALPESVRFAVVAFLHKDDILSVAAVSSDAYEFARSDVLWRPLFYARFQVNPGMPFTLATEDFFNEYCERLTDPKPGDQVEVAWEGTFNLLSDEHVTTYEGRAWWSAVIVEHGEYAYKIHYPQWDASVWDEWVPRHRIRWPMQSHDTTCPIFKGDLVEHHCSSSHGISPWLEGRVTDSAGAKGYRLADVIRSDPKRFVSRDSLRLIQRGRGHLFRRLKISPESKCTIM